MIIKAQAALCNDHTSISNMLKETNDACEKREQMLRLREKVLKAEQERIDGAETLSVSQARKQLMDRMKDTDSSHI